MGDRLENIGTLEVKMELSSENEALIDELQVSLGFGRLEDAVTRAILSELKKFRAEEECGAGDGLRVGCDCVHASLIYLEEDGLVESRLEKTSEDTFQRLWKLIELG